MSSDMLREVSDSLFEYLIDTFPPDRPYSISAIEQDPMPPLLAHFLTRTLRHRVELEVDHLRSVRSPWVDYEHSDVQNTFKAFITSLAQHCHIPSEEWRATLKRATKLVIAHLVLPTHTLVEYIFHDGDGPLPTSVIHRQIGYFAAYPYLREAVETFIKQRQLKEIDRTRFSSLMMQIDKHMIANYTPDDWIRMLKPMFDLMRRIPLTGKQGAPIDLLAMYFGDKDEYEIQERLFMEKELHRVSMINENTLRKVIEGSVGPYEQELISVPEADKSSSEEDEQPSSVKQESATEPSGANTDYTPESKSAEPAKPRPLWEQFQKKPAPTEHSQETNGIAGPEETTQHSSMPLWMQFQKKPDPAPESHTAETSETTRELDSVTRPTSGQAEKHTAAPERPPSSQSASAPAYADENPESPTRSAPEPVTLEQLEFSVLGLYGSSNRDMFIEHLFSGSPQEYQRLLKQLNDQTSWAQASNLIAEEIFKKNNVNIYSPAAIMFTESVEEQYNIN